MKDLPASPIFWRIIAFVLGVHAVFISTRVVRYEGYSQYQKRAQLVFIWLVPLIGAVTCHLFLANSRSDPEEVDREFIPQDPGPYPGGS